MLDYTFQLPRSSCCDHFRTARPLLLTMKETVLDASFKVLAMSIKVYIWCKKFACLYRFLLVLESAFLLGICSSLLLLYCSFCIKTCFPGVLGAVFRVFLLHSTIFVSGQLWGDLQDAEYKARICHLIFALVRQSCCCLVCCFGVLSLFVLCLCICVLFRRKLSRECFTLLACSSLWTPVEFGDRFCRKSQI